MLLSIMTELVLISSFSLVNALFVGGGACKGTSPTVCFNRLLHLMMLEKRKTLLQKHTRARLACRARSDLQGRWKQGGKDYVGRSAEGILRGNNSACWSDKHTMKHTLQ